jgi:ABC-type branched-subunit amino acid transport system ATPase component/ABC-type branched-subunit amino acid transport system permease subunit
MVATVAGAVVGAGAIRFRGPFVAVSTWIASWLVAFGLAAFPGVFGGTQGIPLPEAAVHPPVVGGVVRLSPGIHYEMSLVLVALTLVSFALLSRGRTGLALSASRQARDAATAVGVEGGRLRWGLFIASAMIAGAAGALGVQLAGVADRTAYGPLLSIELFVAVLIGGERTTVGPVIGAAVLALIPPVARGFGSVAGIGPERFEPAIAAALLLVALVAGRGGLIGWMGSLRRRFVHPRLIPPRRPGPFPSTGSDGRLDPTGLDGSVTESNVAGGPDHLGATFVLEARGLTKRFGGVVALDDVSLRLAPGLVHTLIGPNGSGKSTCLGVLAGSIPPDRGSVLLEGNDITALSTARRVRMGIVRTHQQTSIFPELSARHHVMAGAVTRWPYGGPVRTLLATPLAREEGRIMRREADSILHRVGLSWAARVPSSLLSGADQRTLMLATALSARPRVLLLDEPSAGMSVQEFAKLLEILEQLRSGGMTLLIVEHNLRLVRSLAGRVTVLDAGAVIAEGIPDEVARDPDVVRAYLGRTRL